MAAKAKAQVKAAAQVAAAPPCQPCQEEGTTFKCCMCGESYPKGEISVVQSKDSLCGVNDQSRCNKCNSLKSRVYRMTKGRDDLIGFGAMNPRSPKRGRSFTRNLKTCAEPTSTKLSPRPSPTPPSDASQKPRPPTETSNQLKRLRSSGKKQSPLC